MEVDGGGFVYAQEQGGILNVGQMDLVSSRIYVARSRAHLVKQDGLRTPEHLVKYLATLEKRVEAIVRVTPVVIAVDWLAINQTVSSAPVSANARPSHRAS